MTDWIRGINNAVDYLGSGCNDSTTSLTVLDAAANFGSPAPDFFELAIWDADTYPQWESDPAGEIVLVTDVTGNVLTVTRGYGGTTGAAHPAGARCESRFTAEALKQLQDEIDAGGGGGDLKADGTVPLTADWDAGGYEIRAQTFESDVATGTAPLVVASTTVVTNLNADLLDGNHAAAFATSGHTHAGMGDVVGPASATASNFAAFDGTTGKLIKDSTSKAADFATAAHTHAQLHDRAHVVTTAADHTSDGETDGYYLQTKRYVDSYVKSQLSFDGADDSTTITEDVASGPSWSVAGNAHIHTGEKKFGTASLALDGTGDWVSTTNATLNTTLGSQNFTIEMWVYLSANGTQQVFAGQGGGVANWNDTGGGHGFIFFKGSDNKFYWQSHTSGVGGVATVTSGSSYTIAGAWTHLAVVQNGGTLKIYKGGTEVASGSVSSVNYSTGGTQGFFVGTDAAADTPVNGYIDEFRFSVGVARWTTNFTPETSAYSSGNYLQFGNAITNPMTTAGDIIYGGTSGAPTRLATDSGKWLKAGAAAPAWTAIAQADVSGLTTADSVLHASYKIGNADTLLQRDKANSASMATGDQFWTEGLVAKNAGDLICYLLDTYGTNLVGLWLGDQTGAVTTLTDKSLAAHNATLSANASTLTPDVDNLMRHLTLGAATLTVADHADFSPGNGTTDTAFSVVSLVYPTGLTANQNILSKWKLTTGSAAREWRVLVNTSGSLYLECYDQSAGTYIGRTKASVVTSGAWQTLFATYSGSAASSGCKLYRNGVQVDDSNSASGSYTAMEDGDGVVGMHRISTAGAAEEKFSGKVALVAYIKAELTAAQCRALDAKLRGAVGIAP